MKTKTVVKVDELLNRFVHDKNVDKLRLNTNPTSISVIKNCILARNYYNLNEGHIAVKAYIDRDNKIIFINDFYKSYGLEYKIQCIAKNYKIFYFKDVIYYKEIAKEKFVYSALCYLLRNTLNVLTEYVKIAITKKYTTVSYHPESFDRTHKHILELGRYYKTIENPSFASYKLLVNHIYDKELAHMVKLIDKLYLYSKCITFNKHTYRLTLNPKLVVILQDKYDWSTLCYGQGISFKKFLANKDREYTITDMIAELNKRNLTVSTTYLLMILNKFTEKVITVNSTFDQILCYKALNKLEYLFCIKRCKVKNRNSYNNFIKELIALPDKISSDSNDLYKIIESISKQYVYYHPSIRYSTYVIDTIRVNHCYNIAPHNLYIKTINDNVESLIFDYKMPLPTFKTVISEINKFCGLVSVENINDKLLPYDRFPNLRNFFIDYTHPYFNGKVLLIGIGYIDLLSIVIFDKMYPNEIECDNIYKLLEEANKDNNKTTI